MRPDFRLTYEEMKSEEMRRKGTLNLLSGNLAV